MLTEDEIIFAEFIFRKITARKGKRAGRPYLSSKKEWRDAMNSEMASIYYVWRTLSFRIAENIMLPLHSDKYVGPDNTDDLDGIVDYIGFKYFNAAYTQYMTSSGAIS